MSICSTGLGKQKASPFSGDTPGDDAAYIAAIRARLIGNKLTIKQLARALNKTERAIYQAIERYNIPYEKVLNERLLDPEVFMCAASQPANTPPRRRGRPKAP
jgi:hypothetical protein